MKRLVLLATVVFAFNTAFAQQDPKEAIKKTINTMFDGMRKGDSSMLASVFHKDMVLQSIADTKDGTTVLITEKAADFLKAVGTSHKELWDERVTFNTILIDGGLASVWAPYKFYLDQQFSHCGVDVFQLMKTKEGWKIIYITDTRRKDNCPD